MDEKKILDEAERFLKNNKRNIISDLRRLVEIESTKGEEKPGMPYGEGPRKALDTALDMAREMGFEPEEYEGHMGWFDLEGEQKEHIATITHLDVVPAGEGWHFKPYELEEKGNWVVGRGTDDDKGPLIYCMYLAKFFKESGIKLKYTLRTLMGCNEETGMNDVVKYLEKYPHEMSGGQRQRVVIARALINDPELVVCDEPVSALDVSVRSQVLNLLKDLQKSRNLTYIFISHDLSVVEYLCDKVAVMYLGRIMEYADKKHLFGNPLHPYTKALLSAIPVPDIHAVKDEIILEGEVPSPLNPPKGCLFSTRCPYATDKCRTEAPKLQEITDKDGTKRSVACFLHH